MSYYDDIYEFAVDNHYLVTTADAAQIGVPPIELAKLAHRGRLENLSRGLYRLSRYVPSEFDPYAIAVAMIGRDAYLYGESVLALLSLAPTNPHRIYVATPWRIRRKLPKTVSVVGARPADEIRYYEGVRCQSAKDAILACGGTVMTERLKMAAHRASSEGYVTPEEFMTIEERLREAPQQQA